MAPKSKKSKNDKAINTLDLIKESLENDKAEDIQVIDLEGKADFANFMVLATGRSKKHVSSIAEKLLIILKHNGSSGLMAEGINDGNWVLIDAISVVVHVFTKEVREHYQIEKIWSFKHNQS